MSWILKLTLLFVSLSTFSAKAQSDQIGYLYLNGKILNEKKRGQESTIQVFKNRELIDEIQTSSIGKFEFKIALQDSITFAVVSEGYVSKTVLVDTEVPFSKQSSDYNFPFFIDLYPIGRITENVDLDRPVGQILFSGVQFVYHIQYTKRANQRLKEHVSERKHMKVREIEQ